jgi:hypothetical protein
LGIGVWRRSRGNQAEFGSIEYREGTGWLCTRFDPAAQPGSCTIVVTGTVSLRHFHGALTGSVLITVKDRSDGGANATFGPIPLEATRLTVADLQAMQ